MKGFNGVTDIIQSSLIPTRQSTLVEVAINAGVGQNQQISFGNQNTLLDNAVITSIETYYNTICAKSPTGRNIISQADLAKLAVSLTDSTQGQDFYWLKNYPIYNFVTSLNAGIMKQVFWRFITLSKCKLVILDPSVTTPTSVVFAFNYWTIEQYLLFLQQTGQKQQYDVVMRQLDKRGK